jgi:hypothetical protein
LLWLQATIWALLSAGIIALGSTYLAETSNTVTAPAIPMTVVLALATGTFAALKYRLAYRLPRGTLRTCENVIGTEMMMVILAGLMMVALACSGMGLILSPPVIIGGVMSIKAARGLTKPPAQQYFEANDAAAAQPVGRTPPMAAAWPSSGAISSPLCLAESAR